MSLLHNLVDGLRSLFRKEQACKELDEEVDGFLEMAAQEKMKDGMTRADSLRAVRLERGSLEVTKEIVLSAGWGSFGGRQYAEFQKNSNDGYGVEIPHGQSAAFNNASTVWIDNSKANRGPDWVENNSDSGITGPTSPYSDN